MISIQTKHPEMVMKTWGYERWIVNNEELNLCVKELVLTQEKCGTWCSMHRHHIKDEVFKITQGSVRFQWIEDGKLNEAYLHHGDEAVIPAGWYHRFQSATDMEDAVITEASTFHRDEDVDRMDNETLYRFTN